MNWLADIVVVVHALIALFIVAGFVAICLGAWRGYRCVRNRVFRLVHLAAIGFVALTSVVGAACPLTILEDRLRGGVAVSGGFIQRWVGRLLYYDLPGWLFTLTYVVLCFSALLAWRLIPARPRRP